MTQIHPLLSWYWVLSRRSNQHPTQGFSLAELLIASGISSLFFIVALQSTLTGSRYQTLALNQSQLNNWVQADLEPLRNQAGQYNYTTLATVASSGQTQITVASAANFANTDWIMLGSDLGLDTVGSTAQPTNRRYAYKVSSVNTTTQQITLQSSLGKDYNTIPMVVLKAAETLTTFSSFPTTNNKLVIRVADASSLRPGSQIVIGTDTQVYTVISTGGASDPSNPSGSINANNVEIRPALQTVPAGGTAIGTSRCATGTASLGFAAGLRNQAVGSNLGAADYTQNLSQTSTNNQVAYTFQRTMSIVNQEPYNILRVSYAVKNNRLSTNPDSFFTTDIVPTAALYCQ